MRCCFSRNASFIRTAFCEYTLYFFWSFLCDFLLFLLLLSPFFGILAGRQRAPEVAGRMHAGAAFLALPSPRALRFRQASLMLDLGVSGLFCSAHVADAQPFFYVLFMVAADLDLRLRGSERPGRSMAQNPLSPASAVQSGCLTLKSGACYDPIPKQVLQGRIN